MPADLPAWIYDHRRAIGQRVQQHRIEANLTQEQLVELSGLDRSTLQRIEAGSRDPRLSWLQLVARALGVPLAELLAE
ncbi:helix-turn-helix transcriptional regulator [Actinacidiphila oryziradicis]|uniref:helix-turn-helix domain-containing protein n=1 Tax=Actinacidiphila oryziradicis TaxID=2571141 RepID=UPI0023F0C692|nr:helix-turn-helix transcriptional regulator [Actinacidiphila oryziradicis]